MNDNPTPETIISQLQARMEAKAPAPLFVLSPRRRELEQLRMRDVRRAQSASRPPDQAQDQAQTALAKSRSPHFRSMRDLMVSGNYYPIQPHASKYGALDVLTMLESTSAGLILLADHARYGVLASKALDYYTHREIRWREQRPTQAARFINNPFSAYIQKREDILDRLVKYKDFARLTQKQNNLLIRLQQSWDNVKKVAKVGNSSSAYFKYRTFVSLMDNHVAEQYFHGTYHTAAHETVAIFETLYQMASPSVAPSDSRNVKAAYRTLRKARPALGLINAINDAAQNMSSITQDTI